MTLKTGRKCTWDEIEVGEVFAWEGCWQIYQKKPNGQVICLATNMDGCVYDNTGITEHWIPEFSSEPEGDLYKLPISVQRLWRCD